MKFLVGRCIAIWQAPPFLVIRLARNIFCGYILNSVFLHTVYITFLYDMGRRTKCKPLKECRNLKKKIATILVSTALLVAFTGCSRPVTGDKEADKALDSFNKIVKAYPEKKGFHEALKHWGFELPTGEKFEWSKDMSANGADFAMVMLADPLIEAGLDVKKLDKNEWLYEPAGKDDKGNDLPNRLIKPYNVSDKKQSSNGSEDSMRRLLKADTDMVKYHKEQQHYGLNLGEGYQVQWTEKLGLNNADMIFVLKAEPLVKAGLDVDKLDGSGWVFKEASDDDMGMGSTPDQIVKIYDIKS
jgi:hypothetical protein